MRMEPKAISQAQIFGERMRFIEGSNHPFIKVGPTIISKKAHRTECNLLLYANDDSNLKTIRAMKDLYPYSTNFGDLPELTIKANPKL